MSTDTVSEFGGNDSFAAVRRRLFDAAERVLQFPPARENERHFLLAAARRTLSLERAFLQAVEDNNGQVAKTFVRLNLDTLARCYALYWAERSSGMTAESFAREVAGGKEIRSFKFCDQKEKATDRWLIEQISGLDEWIKPVYENTSGVIHFSDFHIKQLFQQAKLQERMADGSIRAEFEIGATERDPPAGLYTEVRRAFLHLTEMLIVLIQHRCDMD